MKRALAWCVGLGLVVAIGAFVWLGVQPWTIVLVLLLLACPTVIVWGALQVRRGSKGPPRKGTDVGR